MGTSKSKLYKKIKKEAQIYNQIVIHNSNYFMNGKVTETKLKKNLEENLRIYIRRIKEVMKGGKNE